MGAIAGVFSRDGSGVDAEVHGMLARMGHRIPGGSASWSNGMASLGQGRLEAGAVPAGAPETLERGDFAITADCRIDNRDELLARLGLRDRASSDAAILLQAYLRWGEECPRFLEGDFAFAVWDGEQRLLFCARDHFGVKPFYYHLRGARFRFASEMRAILAAADVPHAVDEYGIAGFLAGMPDEPQSTLYRDIFRLPPRHSMTVTADRVCVQPYWEFPATVRAPRNDTAEAFRELFTRAVDNRLRGTAPVGAMLSGGLDSSAICSVAAQSRRMSADAPLRTFSLVFANGSPMDERRHIEAVLADGHLDGTLVPVRDYSPFAGFDEIVDVQEGPFLAPGLPLTRRIYDAARASGVRVLLDGHGGDEVVSHGYGRLHELAGDRDWPRLWRECRGAADVSGHDGSALFLSLFMQYGPGWRIARLRRAAARLTGRRAAPARPAWRALVSRDLEARTDLVERYRSSGMPSPMTRASEASTHRWTLAGGLVPHAFEVLDKAAASFGVEPRYPFWDKPLVEFCLSLPAEEKLAQGWTRLVLRKAMEGILPPAVQWRRDKIDFKPALARGMVRHHGPLVERVLGAEGDRVAPYVSIASVRSAFERLRGDPDNPSMDDIQHVWRTVSLSTWLRQVEAEAA